MIETKNNNKIFLVTFLATVIFTIVPALFFRFILSTLEPANQYWNDFDYLFGYYLIFLLLFLISVIAFFFGFKKNEIKNRKIFLIFYFLLFLITCFISWNILVIINPSPVFHQTL
jgi:hypothetical protein